MTRSDSSCLFAGALWLLALSLTIAPCGCGKKPEAASKTSGTARDGAAARPEAPPKATETPSAKAGSAATSRPAVTAAAPHAGSGDSTPAGAASRDTDRKHRATTESKQGASAAEVPHAALPDSISFEKQVAEFPVPPAWLEEVRTQYDTSHPWKDARLEIRRLLSLNTDVARKEAIKLTWTYLQKGDIGDGHEYPMYLFLGGQPVWAVRAYREFLAKPHKEPPGYAYVSLASLYTRFGQFEEAKATLDEAMTRLPAPPWRIAQQANLHEALGDLFATWGKLDLAKEHYAEAVRLYPTSNQPYGQHLLKRQADRVQSKLDLLSVRSLAGARLRDGRYTSTALGYAGDLHVSLVVRDGRMADIQLKHEEKIDQGACVVIPQRIIEKQSLQVDGISGATVTTNAIVDGTLQCLRKAGLP